MSQIMGLAGLPVRQLSSLNRARAAVGNRPEAPSCSAKGANPSHLSASLYLTHTGRRQQESNPGPCGPKAARAPFGLHMMGRLVPIIGFGVKP